MVWRRTAGRVMIAVVVGALVGVLGVVLGQRALIYFPSDVVPAPRTVGLPEAESVRVATDDGLELRAWYVPARGETVGAVLVLPGNGGNRAGRAPLAAALSARGLATLLLDYRGYGGNPGRPSQRGLLADARAGAGALQRHSGVDPTRTVYYGESLGTSVAAGLAAERPPAAVILRSPFPDLAAVGRRHYPWLPVRLLLLDRFPTAEWIATYDGPTLVVTAGRDEIVPNDLSMRVAEVAAADVVTVPAVGHNDPMLLDGAELSDRIARFLRTRAGLAVRAADQAP